MFASGGRGTRIQVLFLIKAVYSSSIARYQFGSRESLDRTLGIGIVCFSGCSDGGLDVGEWGSGLRLLFGEPIEWA
ncbi:hypothetical protein Tco_1466383 [Tanacetum coccineum]